MNDVTAPLLSVCCTTYQHVHFIRQAIEGFLMQRTSFPIEIIIRDDASKDGTAAIVKEYAERHPNLIRAILNEENQFSKGVRPMPDAISHARGKYIAICEGDDYWTDPLKLQKQVDFLEANPSVSMVFHNVWVRHQESRWDRFLNHGIKKDRFTLADVLASEWFVGTCSMVYRRSALEGVDTSPFSWCLSGDMVLQFHLAQAGDFVYMDAVMGVYRRHDGGISNAYWSSNEQTGAHQRQHFEVFRPNHVWMQLAFYERISDVEHQRVVTMRVTVLLQMVIRYLLRQRTDVIPDVGDVRRRLIELVEKVRPAGVKFDDAVYHRIVVEGCPELVLKNCIGHVNSEINNHARLDIYRVLRLLFGHLVKGQYPRSVVVKWILRTLIIR
jgi:glycosyltransferase involved in cell wall biosynthesis